MCVSLSIMRLRGLSMDSRIARSTRAPARTTLYEPPESPRLRPRGLSGDSGTHAYIESAWPLRGLWRRCTRPYTLYPGPYTLYPWPCTLYIPSTLCSVLSSEPRKPARLLRRVPVLKMISPLLIDSLLVSLATAVICSGVKTIFTRWCKRRGNCFSCCFDRTCSDVETAPHSPPASRRVHLQHGRP